MVNKFVLPAATKRPHGYVNTPPSTAAEMRTFIKRHGIVAAMNFFGLGRMAICAIASEQTVQAQTLAAAQDGFSRASELEAVVSEAG